MLLSAGYGPWIAVCLNFVSALAALLGTAAALALGDGGFRVGIDAGAAAVDVIVAGGFDLPRARIRGGGVTTRERRTGTRAVGRRRAGERDGRGGDGGGGRARVRRMRRPPMVTMTITRREKLLVII